MKSVTADKEEIKAIVSIIDDSKYYTLSEKAPEINIKDLRDASIIQTEKRILASLTSDKNLIQAIQALDDVHNSSNLLAERLCTWQAHTAGEPRGTVDYLLSKESLPLPISNLKDTYLHLQTLIENLSKYIDEEAP